MSAAMSSPTAWVWPGPSALRVGGPSRAQLAGELRQNGVALNAHAETLLASPTFDVCTPPTVLDVVALAVREVGLPDGGTLSEVYAAAQARGHGLLPVDAAPYLRLAWLTQPNSADSVLSVGRSPQGALKVATAPISEDVEVPKGFYLRVVDGVPWLRGYRCDDEYRFAAEDAFAFRALG